LPENAHFTLLIIQCPMQWWHSPELLCSFERKYDDGDTGYRFAVQHGFPNLVEA